MSDNINLNDKLSHSKDIVILFISTVSLIIFMMITQYVVFTGMLQFGTKEEIFELPISILINALMAFTGMFSIANGTRSFLGIAHQTKEEDSSLADIPPYKIKQMLGFTITLFILSLFAMVMQMIVGTDHPDFAIKDFVTAAGVSITAYVAARSGSKVANGVYLKDPDEPPKL
jgi:hypothetical protein